MKRLSLTFALLLVATAATASVDATESAAGGQQSRSESKPDSRVTQTPPAERPTEGGQLRLEDITIEGDVDIPRVLFIESRDHLRDHDYLTQLFLESAAQVGSQAQMRRILHWSPKGEQTPWTP